jgi:hypothetical protein
MRVPFSSRPPPAGFRAPNPLVDLGQPDLERQIPRGAPPRVPRTSQTGTLAWCRRGRSRRRTGGGLCAVRRPLPRSTYAMFFPTSAEGHGRPQVLRHDAEIGSPAAKSAMVARRARVPAGGAQEARAGGDGVSVAGGAGVEDHGIVLTGRFSMARASVPDLYRHLTGRRSPPHRASFELRAPWVHNPWHEG